MEAHSVSRTTTIPVPDFGRRGIVTDRPAAGRSFSELTDAINVRITDAGIETIPQLQSVYDFSETPVHAQAFYASDNSGGHFVIYDSGKMVYIDAFHAEVDISPAVAPATEDYWFSLQVNNLLVVTNGTDVPWIIDEESLKVGGVLTPMANWPANYRCKVFGEYKGFLTAGRLTVDGLENRGLIKWAHPLSPGDTDFFWDHTDPTLLAGENQLSVSGRSMKGLQSLRDHLIIYFDTAVWRMTYTGGSYVMSFAQVLTDDGAVGPFAFCDVGGKALVFGYHDVYQFDGYNAESLTNGRIEKELYNTVRINEKLRMFYYAHRGEVYILTEQKPNLAEADTAVIWNTRLKAFTTMKLPGINGLGGVMTMYNSVKFGASDVTYDDMGSQDGTSDITYDEYDRSYNAVVNYDEGLALYLISSQDKKMYISDALTATCHGPENVLIGVDHIDMSQYFGSAGDRMKAIVRIYPYAVGKGQLSWTIGGGDTFNIGKSFWAAVEQDLVEDYAVDTRMSARYLALKVTQGSESDSMFTISGFEFETIAPHSGRQ